tara:strand:- start:2262 stop:2711 length:450 start_codon:yes stop_codon:yes gene_type:complete
MKIQNIIKSISAVIGLLAALFLIRIILAGDEDIKMAASMGEYGKVSALVELARIVLSLSVVITLIFSLRGLFSDIKKLKKAAISVGFFLIVIMISFFLSDGVETPMKDGEFLSAIGSKLVETGIRTFYLLATIALGLMIYSGLIKILKK